MATQLFSTLKSRYRDAYLVARATVGVGSAFKVIGIILGVLITVVSVAVGISLGPERGAVAIFAGIILGAIVAALFYIIGTIVSSQGQILKATLDSAVNTSPHIEQREKAEIMSLVRETHIDSSSVADSSKSVVAPYPAKKRATCRVCGKELKWSDVLNTDMFSDTESLCKEHRQAGKTPKN